MSFMMLRERPKFMSFLISPACKTFVNNMENGCDVDTNKDVAVYNTQLTFCYLF